MIPRVFMQSQQKVRTGLEISGQGNRSTAKRYSIIQLKPTSTIRNNTFTAE